MTRQKPTDKYAQYEHKIRSLNALVEGLLNESLIALEPVTYRDATARYNVTLQYFLTTADWAEEVQVFRIIKTPTKTYHGLEGSLLEAIAGLMSARPYVGDPGERVAYRLREQRLQGYLEATFEADGRKKTRTRPMEVTA